MGYTRKEFEKTLDILRLMRRTGINVGETIQATRFTITQIKSVEKKAGDTK